MDLLTPSYFDLLFPNKPKGLDLYYQNLNADGSSDEILIKWKPSCNYTCSLFNETLSIIRNLFGHLKISGGCWGALIQTFFIHEGQSSLPHKCITARNSPLIKCTPLLNDDPWLFHSSFFFLNLWPKLVPYEMVTVLVFTGRQNSL